jgi:transmembrane sensor
VADFRSIDDTLYETAAEWHARVAGDATEADWLAFTAWLEADPHHRLAFDAVSHASAEIEAQKTLLAAALDTQHPEPAKVVSLDDARLVRHAPAMAARPVSRRMWMAGAGLAAAGLMAAVLLQRPQVGAPGEKVWATNLGQRQTVKLEDGSEIQLNTDTQVAVTFSATTRVARLEKGEAHFDVAHDPQRPFTVMAGDRRVDVVGTAFNVVSAYGDLTVTVARGIVKVGPQVASADGGVKLTIGDQYRAKEGQVAFEVVKVDPEAALAWRNSRLIYDNAPLSQVISDLNRYYPRKLMIEDAATKDLRFSGVLKLDDEDSVLKRLEGLLPVAVQDRGNDLVLEKRSSD